MNVPFSKLTLAVASLAIGAVAIPSAYAGCGQYSGPVPHHINWQTQFASPRLLQAAFMNDGDDDRNPEPSMVGTWKEHWISEGSNGIPDGTEVDAGYAQWHSDGTEINVSGLRAPLTGDVCLGEWIRTGARTYRMNHFGISYDSNGVTLVGPARIQQWLTLDPKGNATTGKFTIDQYDEAGSLLAHVQGNVIGTRVTMNTGFQKVE
ncbi:MAG TPA: hypothetical protein VGF82_17990 [Terracidiphilus sp.]|jgi:hypothetical protein